MVVLRLVNGLVFALPCAVYGWTLDSMLMLMLDAASQKKNAFVVPLPVSID